MKNKEGIKNPAAKAEYGKHPGAGNVNPAKQDKDSNSVSNKKVVKATSHNPNQAFNGSVDHDYTSKNN